MTKFPLISILFFFVTVSAYYPTEFLYPVAEITHEGQEKMCVLYQKNNHLELWFWNPLTGESTKGLLSSFTPAGLTVLPNKKTFSFIDNDRIRIKQTNKRSPRSLDLYGPYDLTTIHWIDNHSFYFGAKERQHGNLFHANLDGDLYRLTVSNKNDYTYPVKVDDYLFFIEHSDEDEYIIMKAKYPVKILENQKIKELDMTKFLEEENDEYVQHLDLENSERILTLNKNAPAFLLMKDSVSGFFIEHPDSVQRTDETMTFSYHTFYKTDDEGWKTEKLFDFTLPLYLLLPQQDKVRLYESILPFLPFHDQDIIYYSNLSLETNSIDIYSYNCTDKSKTKKTMIYDNDSVIFPPRIYQNRLFSGGTLDPNFLTAPVKSSCAPAIDIDQSGIQYFNFLEILKQ
jgi:hypothetical protein